MSKFYLNTHYVLKNKSGFLTTYGASRLDDETIRNIVNFGVFVTKSQDFVAKLRTNGKDVSLLHAYSVYFMPVCPVAVESRVIDPDVLKAQADKKDPGDILDNLSKNFGAMMFGGGRSSVPAMAA